MYSALSVSYRVKRRKLVQNKNIVILQKIWKRNVLLSIIESVIFGAYTAQLSATLHIFKNGGGCFMLCVYLSSAKTTGVFFRIKRNGIELRTGKILEENLVQSAFLEVK
jgi:hypothetical protein